MPRPKTRVKRKTKAARTRTRTGGAVDLHFHGAFGIDLMTASGRELTELSSELAHHGVAAFCPTTLSVSGKELRETVARLGPWVREALDETRNTRNSPKSAPGALPLGLHLEGPFISSAAAGAHPPGVIRPVDFEELGELWKISQGTLKILTVAPEALSSPADLARLARFCRKMRIRLSLGHSKASEAQARAALDAGFTGVTHAWNALGFHHRAPGVLGAALGRKDVWVEVIPDGIHLDPTLIRWTLQLHGADRVCFVSDCAPAAATPEDGTWHPFGPLKIRLAKGACRLADGSLAGGGMLLPESFARWLEAEARLRKTSPARLLSEVVGCIGRTPLEALGLGSAQIRAILDRSPLSWTFSSRGRVAVRA